MDLELQKRIKSLPQEVIYLLTAEKAVDLSVILSDRYEFNQEQIGAFTDLIAKIYLKDVRLSELYTSVKQIFGYDDERAKQLVCDIAGLKLLSISDWLGEDVANYIRGIGGDPDIYQLENDELKRQAAAEMAAENLESREVPDLIPADTDDEDDNIDESWEDDNEIEETESVGDDDWPTQFKTIFNNQLMDLLTTDDNIFIEEFNLRLINLLGSTDDFKNELINILMNNNTRLSVETIVLDGRQVDSSIGNWIRYYISQKGSGPIDSVSLSDFLVNAPNARFLNSKEKILVSHVLQLYSNIKHFPDSLVGDNPKNWILLPLSAEPGSQFVELSDHSIRAIDEPHSKQEQEISPKQMVRPKNPKPKSDTNKINSLRQLSGNYEPGSLERLAIEEEIKRLSDL